MTGKLDLKMNGRSQERSYSLNRGAYMVVLNIFFKLFLCCTRLNAMLTKKAFAVGQ